MIGCFALLRSGKKTQLPRSTFCASIFGAQRYFNDFEEPREDFEFEPVLFHPRKWSFNLDLIGRDDVIDIKVSARVFKNT